MESSIGFMWQIGNLPFTTARRMGGVGDEGEFVHLEACGVHLKIRLMCRKDYLEMDCYPVKDILPFENDDELLEVQGDEGDDEVGSEIDDEEDDKEDD